MLLTLENNTLTVAISTLGAELQSIYRKDTQLEYLWQGNPQFWGKRSPVLFPIVGGLKDGKYHYAGNSYKMGRHGFAREQQFEVVSQSTNSIALRLTANDATLQMYPFAFELTITYTLTNDTLTVSYDVGNVGNDTMYASIGAHPAFNVPLTTDTTFEDYYLQFEQIENVGIYPLTAAGLLKTEPVPYLQKANAIPLVKSMFYGDALVFKQLKSNSIAILSTRHEHGVTVQYENMPYMGIWSAKDAPFVCIEPWHGIADSENATGDITNKEGIVAIPKGEYLHCNMRITLF